MAIKYYDDGTAVHYSDRSGRGIVRDNSINALKEAKGKERKYRLTSKAKRLVRASCVRLFKEREVGEYAHFILLSYPSGFNVDDETLCNKAVERFLKNARANFQCSGYVAVKEKGEKNGRPHWHVVLRAPFVSYKKLNAAYVKVFNNMGFEGSDNCLSTPPRTRADGSVRRGSSIIRDVKKVVRYITKYISKADSKNAWSKRCYLISNTVIAHPCTLDDAALINYFFDNSPPQWRWVGENFAITRHELNGKEVIESWFNNENACE